MEFTANIYQAQILSNIYFIWMNNHNLKFFLDESKFWNSTTCGDYPLRGDKSTIFDFMSPDAKKIGESSWYYTPLKSSSKTSENTQVFISKNIQVIFW